MPTRLPYARIAITLPKNVLAAADRYAAALDRSRSWLIAEAVRRFTSDQSAAHLAPAPQPGLGESRRAQLVADLRLSPEQRVREAEETARVAELTVGTRRGIVAFDKYEDYLAFKRLQDAGA